MTVYSSIRIQDWLGSPPEPGGNLPKHLEAACREPLVPLLLGEDSGERATCLLFRPGRPEPILVLKIARTDPGRRSLENEYNVLRALRARVPGDTNRFFPLAIAFRNDDCFSGLLQEAAAGETWFRRLRTPPGMGDDAIIALSRTFIERLASLGDLSLTKDIPDAKPEGVRAAWESCIDAVTTKLSERRPLSPAESKTLESLKEKTRAIDTFRFQHGDLFPKNVLLSGPGRGGSPVLIDWAEAGSHLPPLFDEILLLSTLWRKGNGLVGEGERIDHFRQVFWESTGFEALVEEAFREGQKRWKLAGGWTREDLLLLALAVYGRRIASLFGPAHEELRILITNMEYTLSKRVDA